MHILNLWGSLILAQAGTYLMVASQYISPFAEQKPIYQQKIQSQQEQKSELASLEPSCEELRAMWIYSKRQSRAAETTNELPLYRDPFSHNIWEAYASNSPSSFKDDFIGPARSRSGGVPIYGKLVHKAPAGHRLRNGMQDRTRAFEEFSKIFGTVNQQPSSLRRKPANARVAGGGGGGPSHAGSFQSLKEFIISERAKELQEQRKQDELTARAAAIKEIAAGDKKQRRFQDSRNVASLGSLQSYENPESLVFRQRRHVATDTTDFNGQLISDVGDNYEREMMFP